jgi:hypothetical protein
MPKKTYKLKANAQILPNWLQNAKVKGGKIAIKTVRLKLQDGTTIEVDPTKPFEVEEDRVIRHLDADPRFDKL